MPALAAPLALAAALLVSACGTAPRATGEAHASLVAAERAFARDALDAGVRAAFLRHFATGGLLFVPAPARVEDVFARPPADPHAALLEWEPVASGVAASGDFGYTTGPARFSRRDGSSPVRHSTFFSVWKRIVTSIFPLRNMPDLFCWNQNARSPTPSTHFALPR